jgi:signal peptidase I
MDPTVRNRQVRVLNLLAYTHRDPQRFDIVAIQGTGPRHLLLKRIVGLPGETIAWDNGNLRVNGVVVEEPYLVGPINWDIAPQDLGDDEYFVAGDNRGIDLSRQVLGTAYRRHIFGKLAW